MRENQFRDWLKSGEIQKITSKGTINSRISNCKKIEKSGYNLDSEYNFDSGKRLIELLTYSKKDFNSKIKPIHQIEINGDRNIQQSKIE